MAPLASSIKNGAASGLLIRTRPAPTVNLPVKSPQRRIGRKLGVELERDRALGGQGRRLLVERLEVGEAEVAPLDREGRRIAVRGLRRDCPRSRRTGRRDRGVRPRARMIECDGEVVVDDGALRRLVFDLEMAAGEGQPVERLGGAGHGFGRGADEGGKAGGASRPRTPRPAEGSGSRPYRRRPQARARRRRRRAGAGRAHRVRAGSPGRPSAAAANGSRPTRPLGAERTVWPAASRTVKPLKPRPTPHESCMR